MNEPLDEKLISYILTQVGKEASGKGKVAAYNGERHDGGEREMKEKLAMWLDGIENKIPEAYQKHVKQFARENDPEYKLYLRLQEKFEE